VTVEYLVAGGWPRPRLYGRLVAGVIVAVLLACAVVWGSDKVKNDANESLSAALVGAQQQAVAGEARVVSTLSYTYPMIWSTSVSDDVRAGLRQIVQASAAEVVTSLTEMRVAAAAVRLLPWQVPQLAAQAAVLSLIDAQLRRFERIATDATVIGPVLAEQPPSDAEASRLLRASGAGDQSNR
jgi:hypothetical protein